MSEVTAQWERIERWLEARGELRQLRPPATEEQIAAAQAELGITFPNDLRESLLRHDGVIYDAWPEFSPLSTINIVKRSRQYLPPSDKDG